MEANCYGCGPGLRDLNLESCLTYNSDQVKNKRVTEGRKYSFSFSRPDHSQDSKEVTQSLLYSWRTQDLGKQSLRKPMSGHRFQGIWMR